MNLSDTQQAILAMIAERIADGGAPPSQAEIAKAFGFSGVRAAQYHIEALEAAGAIRRIPGQARGIRLIHDDTDIPVPEEILPDNALRLPILGRVAAGLPIGADIQSDEVVLLDRAFFAPAPDYLLKVQGDSMRDEGIFDGDLIGVHRTPEARSGQIVVARIDDEITVKLLKIGKDRIRLLPRNPDYSPIDVMPDQDFAIEGLYCGAGTAEPLTARMQSDHFSNRGFHIKQEFSDVLPSGIPVATFRVVPHISITATRVASCATHGR